MQNWRILSENDKTLCWDETKQMDISKSFITPISSSTILIDMSDIQNNFQYCVMCLCPLVLQYNIENHHNLPHLFICHGCKSQFHTIQHYKEHQPICNKYKNIRDYITNHYTLQKKYYIIPVIDCGIQLHSFHPLHEKMNDNQLNQQNLLNNTFIVGVIVLSKPRIFGKTNMSNNDFLGPYCYRMVKFYPIKIKYNLKISPYNAFKKLIKLTELKNQDKVILQNCINKLQVNKKLSVVN